VESSCLQLFLLAVNDSSCHCYGGGGRQKKGGFKFVILKIIELGDSVRPSMGSHKHTSRGLKLTTKI